MAGDRGLTGIGTPSTVRCVMRLISQRIIFLLVGGAAVTLGGCGRPVREISWAELVRRLADRDYICRIDQPPTHLVSSSDPSGGNDDFNHFVRGPEKSPALLGSLQPEEGWVVLADLKGPGYVQRFWFTGAKSGDYRLRFFLDGEKQPRLETSLKEWCGGSKYTKPPIGAYENYCWYCWLPIPYRKRLVIMAQSPQWASGRPDKLFYQINYAALPRGTTVKSFVPDPPEEVRQALSEVRRLWQARAALGRDDTSLRRVTLAPRSATEISEVDGPGVIDRIVFRIERPLVDGEYVPPGLLRQLVIKAWWDAETEPSVAAPLGDFCGEVWRPVQYAGYYWGMTGNTFFCDLPMPFRDKARVAVENRSAQTVEVSLQVDARELAGWDGTLGYLHTAWRKTGPEDVGRPHLVVETSGKGRLASLLLSAASRDRSWWLLEGDELILRDDEEEPGWKGTGLEDYFNGGWYYQAPLPRPLHGVVFKAPFRVVQYRIHQADTVTFDRYLKMWFERGPDNASHGWLESLCFYYLAQPRAHGGRLCGDNDCLPPDDGLWNATLMTELINYERMGDLRAALQRIRELLAAVPGFPFSDILRARAAIYEELLGKGDCREVLEQIREATVDDKAKKQIDDFLWQREAPGNALLGLYCNMRTRVFIDGQLAAEGEDAERMLFYRVSLSPGKHVIAVQSGRQQYPDWVQVCLRTSHGDFGTGSDWRYAFEPRGNWAAEDYDDEGWGEVGGTGVKGPPEAPYIWLEPNLFVGIQSGCVGIRPPVDWPPGARFVVYRKRFQIHGN